MSARPPRNIPRGGGGEIILIVFLVIILAVLYKGRLK